MSLSAATINWLEHNCSISLKGKTVLVTGSTSGVGYKTAELAAYFGADVILACRNPEKAEKCRAALQREYSESRIRYMILDLADFRSIDTFVEDFVSQKIDVDVFLNNAGALHHPGEKTADGFDLVIGTNYLGVYRLSEQLLPYLATLPHAVCYINTVSAIIRIAGEPDYSHFYRERANSLSVYGRSKLCLAKYTLALAKRYEGRNVRVLMCHPGATITPLGLNAVGKGANALAGLFQPFMNSPEKSALSLAYILSNDVSAGSIVGPDHGFGLWGYPEINRIPKRVSSGAEVLIDFTELEIGKKIPNRR